MRSSSFKIINASAGSGKTTSLVYHFLLRLFLEPDDIGYRNMLALTFTNKAVNEMKKKILEGLYNLGYKDQSDQTKRLKKNLLDNLSINSNELRDRSQRILKNILHEYAAFEVITLDSFTNKIIRNFSRELNLPSSYDLIIESKQTFQDITNRILEKVGIDKSLTNLLVSFSLSKVENLKSWDIAFDINEFSKILLNENNRIAISDLRGKDLEKFLKTKKNFLRKRRLIKEKISKTAKEVLEKFAEGNLEKENFIRGTIYNYFKEYSNIDLNKNIQNTFDFDNRLLKFFENDDKLYPQSTPTEKKDFIDNIESFLREKYMELRMDVGQVYLFENLLSQWTTLSLLGKIEYELEDIQNEKGEILLERFNEIIDKVILEQPVIPFIYEKLGVRYRHYFIDEFQDTSKLQWSNLIPLVSHSLEGLDDKQREGSLILVGDPKQAIYGWRGGDNIQFLKLLDNQSNFQVESEIFTPGINHRSLNCIVDFNDDFFKFINHKINTIKSNKTFNFTQESKKTGGYVEIKVVDKLKNKEQRNISFVNQAIKTLIQINNSGFNWGEIAILTRTRKEVVSIANALSKENIPFVSSESLSVSESKSVNFLITLIRSIIDPSDMFQRKEVLEFLWQINFEKEDYQDLMFENLDKDQSQSTFFKEINKTFGYSFNPEIFSKVSLYEAIEYAIKSFRLKGEIDAYLIAFLDDVFEFSTNQNQNLAAYISYWEERGSEIIIPMPEGKNCVIINTIHKSKGLEFSNVILPFLEDPLISLKNYHKVWYPINNGSDNNFNWGWVNFSEKLKLLGDKGDNFYKDKILKSQLESLNVLYVSLTRAINNLFLICPKENDLNDPLKSYSTLINQFLIEENKTPEDDNSYVWGKFFKPSKRKYEEENSIEKIPIEISTNWHEKLHKKNLSKDLNPQSIKSNKGIVIHELLSRLKYGNDLTQIINFGIETNKIKIQEKKYYHELITKIIKHPELKDYYSQSCYVLNEQDILIPKKSFVRPDRIVKTLKGWTIIDYKTGTYKLDHETQLFVYEKILNEMGLNVYRKYLVYIGENIEVRSIKLKS